MKEKNKFLDKTSYRIKRYYGYALATIIAIAILNDSYDYSYCYY